MIALSLDISYGPALKLLMLRLLSMSYIDSFFHVFMFSFSGTLLHGLVDHYPPHAAKEVYLKKKEKKEKRNTRRETTRCYQSQPKLSKFRPKPRSVPVQIPVSVRSNFIKAEHLLLLIVARLVSILFVSSLNCLYLYLQGANCDEGYFRNFKTLARDLIAISLAYSHKHTPNY
jgi:hypothetical protein